MKISQKLKRILSLWMLCVLVTGQLVNEYAESSFFAAEAAGVVTEKFSADTQVEKSKEIPETGANDNTVHEMPESGKQNNEAPDNVKQDVGGLDYTERQAAEMQTTGADMYGNGAGSDQITDSDNSTSAPICPNEGTASEWVQEENEPGGQYTEGVSAEKKNTEELPAGQMSLEEKSFEETLLEEGSAETGADKAFQQELFLEQTEAEKTENVEMENVEMENVETENVETESEEAETEEAEEEANKEKYQIFFRDDEHSRIMSDAVQKTEVYEEGDRIRFTVQTDDYCEVSKLLVVCCDGEEDGEWNEAFSEEQTPEGNGLQTLMSQSVVSVQSEEEENSYSFIMPSSDVMVACETQMSVLAAAADGDQTIDQIKVVNGDASKAGNLAWIPKKLASVVTSANETTGFSNIKQVTLYDALGKKIDQVLAYCLQPNMPAPDDGVYSVDDLTLTELANDPAKAKSSDITVSATAKSRALAKAMYYLYLGPAWGKDVQDENGAVYNFQKMLKSAGCSDTQSAYGFKIHEDYYFMTHMVLDYINNPNAVYSDGSEKWNTAWGPSNGPVKNALNAEGQKLVKNIASILEKMPSATTCFSSSAVNGTFSVADGKSKSGNITFEANSANEAQIKLPDHVQLVNAVTGKLQQGTAVIKGGETFYFQADPEVSGKIVYQFSTSMAVGFKAYKISNENKQDLGFAYEYGSTSLQVTVAWPETGKIRIKKTDQITGGSTPFAAAYSLEGAVYGIFSDLSCTVQVMQLKTDQNGQAVSESLPLGTYYVKELNPSSGYKKDEKIYTVAVNDTIEKTVTSIETPITGAVVIEKTLEEMDNMTEEEKEKLYESGKLSGIIFTLTHENKEALGKYGTVTVETDRYGIAKTNVPLAAGNWRVEETDGVPFGYRVSASQNITLNFQNMNAKLEIHNKKYEGWLRIKKRDAVSGSLISLVHTKFQIFHAEDYTPVLMKVKGGEEDVTVFETDDQGVIEFENPIKGGSYILKEIEAPEYYQNAQTEIPFTIERDYPEGKELELTVDNQPFVGKICILKKDAAAGTVCGAGFRFGIYAKEDILDGAGVVRTGCEKDSLIQELVTDDSGRAYSDDLYAGSYYFTELETADGFALSDQLYSFEISDAEAEVIEMTVENHPTELLLRKADNEVLNHYLQGVVFRIKEKEEEDREDQLYRTDENGEILIRYLKKGTEYLITEEQSAPGYVSDEQTFSFAVDRDGLIDNSWRKEIVIGNTPNTVMISKKDITSGEEIEGAVLRITACDEQQTLIEEWVSEKEAHQIKALPAGDYLLTEITAPEGYVRAETIRFCVTDTLEVQKVDMLDDYTKVEISKSDLTNGKPVIGAKLSIRDADGKTVEEWITTDQPHFIEKLPVGDYILEEITAPYGYEMAEAVSFTVEETGEIQKVDMKDRPIPEKTLPSEPDLKKAELSSGGHSVPGTGDELPLMCISSLCAISFLSGIFLLWKRFWKVIFNNIRKKS